MAQFTEEEHQNSMITSIHNSKRLAKSMEFPDRSELCPDMASVILLTTGEQAHGPRLAEPRIEEGGDNGDHDDNHGSILATGDGRYGLTNMDPGAIVDDVLADLPEPARHHILPQLEEYRVEALCSAI